MGKNIIEHFKDARNVIKEIGSEVTSEDIDTYRQFREIQDKSYKLNIIVDAWKIQQREERKLRNIYAGWLLAFLFVQMILINISFFLIGQEILKIEKWVANTFIIAVFTEIVSMIMVIIRYLFPKSGSNFPEIFESL